MVATVSEAIASFHAGDTQPLTRLMELRQQQLRKGHLFKKKDASATNLAVDLDDQVRELPSETLDKFYPQAIELSGTVDDDLEHLERLEAVAQFVTMLVDTKDAAISPAKVFMIAQNLHGQLLRLRGDPDKVLSVQDSIAMLCESCWKQNFHGMAHALVTQLLPYLIVRSYECPASGAFNSRKHPVRRLFAIKDALELLDFEDESSGLLRDILLRCYIQPNLFRSPDAIPFLSFLFELHMPFVSDINQTIRNQIPNQRRSILKKYGSIYFKAWVGSSGESREKIEEDCIQRYIHDAVHAGSISMFTATRSVLQIFFENKRHTGVDEMLYRICSPILWRGVKAANDSVRRQAAVLLFDNFPLRDPQFNNEQMDLTLQKQFDAFEELLGDSHPAVRIAAIQGVSKVLSVYWELLPAETIRCFISKLVVDLVNDASSSSVRAAVFEGVQFILDNHNSHSILKPLLPMLAPLINDRNERVRAEFAALLVRIKSIRNLHFYDVVSVNDLLDRMVLDKDCPVVRKQLVSLFLNSYFPQSVGGSSQVARCLALVKKNPEAALAFYGSVAEHASVGSVCKLAALLLRCSLNFVSKRLKEPKGQGDDGDEEDEEDDDEEGFSIVGQVVVLEVISSLLSSVHEKVMTDPRYAECKSFVAEQLSVQSIEALLLAYSEDRPFDQEALSSVWKIVGYLGELSEDTLLERLVENMMTMDESSSKKLLESLVNCLSQWDQLPFLVSKLVRFLHHWKENEYVVMEDKKKKKAATKGSESSAFKLNPIVVLGAAEYIVQSPSVNCPKELIDQLFAALQECVAPILEMGSEEFVELYKANSFRVMRLLEVFAKFTLMTEGARVADRTSVLMEKSTKHFSSKDELKVLQPSAFFTPPESLALLSTWVTRLLLEFRNAAHDENMANLTKKRRRGKNGENEEELSPQQQLLVRWRNLFSLVSLLNAECVEFAFQNENISEEGIAAGFVANCVDDLVEALDDAKYFERVLFYQSCQLLFQLNGIKAKKEKKTKKASSARILPSLVSWTSKLHEALEKAHEKDSDKSEDLWAAISPSIKATEVPVA
uniref:Uncharacterized protein n=1 Tax=Globisporangium ultimum (strain ATCC 200006 / CBS 805.95 / DAOM BR144) TaxID=431595 RepID=K3WUA7_GLOUD